MKKNFAVNKLCFGVKEGECFGLLGVNGAGSYFNNFIIKTYLIVFL